MAVSKVEHIKKLPLVVSVEELSLSKTVAGSSGKKWIKEARSHQNKVRAYRFTYQSQRHLVEGFLVEPKEPRGELPCIIWNRGGSQHFGSITTGTVFTDLANFAQEGYVVIASQYSGGNAISEGKDEFGGFEVQDVLNLYNILDKYRHADTARIGMYGHSRGGLMTYLALTKVKWIKAAVAIAAPANEVRAPHFRKGWGEHQKAMYGGSRKEQIKRSAVYWANKFHKKTPILIMHGTADWRVNPQDSIDLAGKLYHYKIPFKLVMFEGADHIISEFPDEMEQLAKDWFLNYLKRGKKLPNLKPHGK